MKTALKLTVFTVVVTGFYDYIGHWVPQKEVHPPKVTEVSGDMTTGEMVAAGQEIVNGKGTCTGCHTISSKANGRFPDLDGIGARAASRVDGMSDVEYLAQSLYEPDAFIVEGFSPGMTPAHKPPISLSDPEILSVIAYLQSLGGSPSVTMQTKLKHHGTANAPAAAPPATASADPKTLLATYCVSCHAVDGPERRVGPSLFELDKVNSTQLKALVSELAGPQGAP